MELIDLLTPEQLFHPSVFYDGEWLLGGEFNLNAKTNDYLLLNAKTVKGKNAYLEYLEKHFFRPMAGAINSESVVRPFFPKITLHVDEETQRRVVTFSLSFFLYEQLSGLLDEQGARKRFAEKLKESSKEEEWVEAVKQELRQDRKFYSDVQMKGRNSPYYPLVYQTYLDFVRYSRSMMDFSAFLEGKISGSTKLIVGARYYPEIFKQEIDTKELVEAFEYDKFCLLAARSALDGCKLTEERENLVDNAASYVKVYLDAVSKLQETNPKYHPTIQIRNNETNRIETIGVEEIRKEFEALLARHPEFSFIQADQRQIETLLRTQGLEEEEISSFDISQKHNQELIATLLEKLRKDRILAAQWKFIPKGSRLESESGPKREGVETTALPTDEKVRRMLICREFLDNSPYVCKLYGMDKFEGYIGYMYLNGAVVFNKFYSNIKTKQVASEEATYVMRFDNFMELSRLSKSKIIHMIKHDRNAHVKRIFHREDMDKWIAEVKRVIAGDDYQKEVEAFIELMVQKEELKKVGEKS